jgi:hypothetical protein
MDKTFAMISLGCAKNLVNTEQMLYLMDEAGYTLVPEPVFYHLLAFAAASAYHDSKLHGERVRHE